MPWLLAPTRRVCSPGQITDGFSLRTMIRLKVQCDPLPSCSSRQVRQSALIGKAGLDSHSHPGRQRDLVSY